jgi:Rrf2 family protein
MKISAQEEYGLRCLVHLARHGPGVSQSLRQIAEAEGISTAYAGKLLWILNRAGLVKSVRGVKGGYTLARPADEIMLTEVIKVLGDEGAEQFCQHFAGGLEVCVHNDDCSIRPLVMGLNHLIHDVLSRISLARLVEGGFAPTLTRIGSIEGRRAATARTGGRNEHD